MPAPARERAALVGLDVRSRNARSSSFVEGGAFTAAESLAELVVLTGSAGAEVVLEAIQSRESAEAATLIGSGKVEELAAAVKSLAADLVVFDAELSPTQQRNLERALDCKVIDRTQLILDIFAARARTREGQLQVELAQLNYMLPRLAGRGIEMSRLGGGIGTRGPGETQLETDRRRIGTRIAKIERDLEQVRAGRGIQRRKRQSVPLATISLVGYTNAGKSTLFNRITQAQVTADARMFATLDPTVRQLTLPSNRRVLVSDTVGFIRNLPTTLVKAFRATLEEVIEASLLLHVVDGSSPQASEHAAHVSKVLTEIGAESTPQLLVINKADQLPADDPDRQLALRRLLLPSDNRPRSVSVSALKGDGVPELLEAMDALVALDPVAPATFHVPHSEGAALHFLHEYARVVQQTYHAEYSEVVAEVPESVRRRLMRFLAGPSTRS